ncbi:MAG: hypothetical protein Q4B29_01225, partial [Candidatus Saccharibacteria bacterium]|nr:hypothetical protein [Candidatus Saccharibacteria bacterium]
MMSGGGYNSLRSEQASQNLVSAERLAEAAAGTVGDSLGGARENEMAAPGFYSGDGRLAAGLDRDGKGKGKGKGFLKRKGPM